uniref:Uncharacterized protein n=1 Tax=Heterorhabditis bacteriophora TaxID=37862 RepID=A0A1I7X8I2_HETBA
MSEKASVDIRSHFPSSVIRWVGITHQLNKIIHLAREPSTNVQLNFVVKTSLEDEVGCGRSFAIEDSQLRIIVEEEPRKTTREVVEELNVN